MAWDFWGRPDWEIRPAKWGSCDAGGWKVRDGGRQIGNIVIDEERNKVDFYDRREQLVR